MVSMDSPSTRRLLEPADAPIAGKALRVGWLVEPGFGPVDREVATAVADAAELLKDLGCEVEPVRIPLLEQNNYFRACYHSLRC